MLLTPTLDRMHHLPIMHQDAEKVARHHEYRQYQVTVGLTKVI